MSLLNDCAVLTAVQSHSTTGSCKDMSLMWLFSHTLSRSRQHCWSLRGQCAAGGDEAPGLKGSDWWRVPSFRAVHQWKATRCLCIPLHLSNLITTVLDLKKKINCTNMMLSCQPLLWQPLWTEEKDLVWVYFKRWKTWREILWILFSLVFSLRSQNNGCVTLWTMIFQLGLC